MKRGSLFRDFVFSEIMIEVALKVACTPLIGPQVAPQAAPKIPYPPKKRFLFRDTEKKKVTNYFSSFFFTLV